MDQRSKQEGDPTQWKSIKKDGVLLRHENGTYTVSWNSEVISFIIIIIFTILLIDFLLFSFFFKMFFLKGIII